MTKPTRHWLTGIVFVATVLSPVTMLATPASAFPKGDPIYKFKYKVVATSTIAKAGLTLSPPPGIFKGGIDLANGQLLGGISLPNTTFTQSEAGLANITATAAIIPAKQVTGKVNIGTFKVTATSVFNIHILTMYVSSVTLPTLPTLPPLPIGLPISLPPIALPPIPIPPVNLVGDSCGTASPIKVTMSGIAHLEGASKFSGGFTMPPFANCGAMTSVINQEIPGPGNTFSAVATPAK